MLTIRSIFVFRMLEQFMLTLAHNISAEILRIFCFLAKRQPPSRRSGAMARRAGGRARAVQDTSRISRNHLVTHSVLECGGPPPLFPETYQTAPMLIGTAIEPAHAGCYEETGAIKKPRISSGLFESIANLFAAADRQERQRAQSAQHQRAGFRYRRQNQVGTAIGLGS